MGKKIALTGGSGHIGYHVALFLLKEGYDVRLLIRKENSNVVDLKNRGAKTFTVDLLNPSTYNDQLEDTDVLFHIASVNTTETADEESIINNTFELTKKVIDTAISAGVKSIIYTSSVVVLGRSSDPRRLINENNKTGYLESPYVKGKFLADNYCDEMIKENSVDIRRIYPSWVVGSNNPKMTPPHNIIFKYLQKGQLFYFGGGISVTCVQEVAKAHVNAWLLGKPNEKYIVGGDNITFKEFYKKLAKLSGNKEPIIYMPKWIIFLGSVVAKILLGKKNPIDPKYVKSIINNYSWYNSEKAIKELKYKIPDISVTLKTGIDEERKRLAGLQNLVQKENFNLTKTNYEEDDILLITGFPGWLGNRMIDVLMNGDRWGSNSVNRKIRLLIQPKFKGIISLPLSFEIFYGDVTDKNSLKNALKNVKSVYHLAGVIYPKEIKTFYEVNYKGTKNLVDACVELGVRRILFMSTDSVCGYGKEERVFNGFTKPNPYKNYGRSKYLAEKYILDKTTEGLIDGTSLRGFWFFGPFMPERNKNFLRMFHWKKQIVFGNGKNYRSISHIDNTIQAFIKAEKRKETFGKWYWIGGKKSDYTVDEIYKNIADGLGVNYNPIYIFNWMCELFSIFDTIIGWFGRLNPTIHAAGKFHKDIAGDISDAVNDFDYNPNIGFEEIKKELKNLTL
ncbi:MAG: NAD-dependent epimerase/dehydratase family protein [Bacteroidetes bacterium]|nr:NAD-dependent epimerase/dehydratase family protein [Bacteroidota bacterium]